jgi:hypothetical protein
MEQSENIETMIDNFNPNNPVPEDFVQRAPGTAGVLESVTGMSRQQLDRLARAGNYRPRGEA